MGAFIKKSPVPKDSKSHMERNISTYVRKFTQKAHENGYSEDNLKKCLEYAIPLLEKDLPVIYNTTHFAQLVGYKVNYLKRAVKFPKYFYRDFKIKKKNGDTRLLYEPLPSLKEIQDWILNEVLYKNKVSRYAKAYVPKRSIKEHAMYHTDEEKVFTLDIEKFFNTIQFSLTEDLFKKMGYSPLLSNLFTKLCYLNDELPQGAPTSPYISNLILREFDNVIGNYCIANDIKYTRYADDLAFSGKLDENRIEQLVKFELDKLGLNLNDNKRRIMKQNVPQLISGIIVNKKSQVPRKERNKLRNTMFYIKKFGLEDHMKKTGQERKNYLKHLKGKINYVLQIHPRDKEFQEYKRYLASIEVRASR